jgi:hypothetical protein
MKTGRVSGSPQTELRIRYVPDPGKPGTGAQEWVLTCPPAGGDHPNHDEACAILAVHAAAGIDPFAPTPEGQPCAMVYGGPATASVEGHWNGRPVHAMFTRVDGCEVARWDRLVPLLPPT